MTKIYELSGIIKTNPDDPTEQDERTEAAEKLYGTAGISMDPIAEITKFIGKSVIPSSSYTFIKDSKERVVYSQDKDVVNYYFQYRKIGDNTEIVRFREYDKKTGKTKETRFVPFRASIKTAQITSEMKSFDSFDAVDRMAVSNQTIEEKNVSAPAGTPIFKAFLEDEKGVTIVFSSNTSNQITINTMI